MKISFHFTITIRMCIFVGINHLLTVFFWNIWYVRLHLCVVISRLNFTSVCDTIKIPRRDEKKSFQHIKQDLQVVPEGKETFLYLSSSICFNMSTTNCSSPSTSNENSSNIQVTVHKVTYVWAIDNFHSCETNGTILRSPEFSASTNVNVKWYIKLKPNGNTCHKDTISLHLHLSASGVHSKTIFAKNTMSILYEQKKQVSKNNLEVRKFAAATGWGWQEFCKKNNNFRTKLLSNDVLRISCEVTFFQESDILAALNSTIPNCDISENLGTLLKTYQLADVVISAKGKDYPVHKAILAARSKVFAAMFLHDTKENQLNRIDIEDMSEEVVTEMLRFIYTGSCQKLDEFSGELLAAADKYDLSRLKIMCSQTLSKNLSVENAANILLLAEMYNVNELKIEAIKVVVAKPIEVFNTTGWKNVLTNPRLIDEICRAIALR